MSTLRKSVAYMPLVMLLCLFGGFASYTIAITGPGTPGIGVLISELDGNPVDVYASKIVFPNGTTSITGGVNTVSVLPRLMDTVVITSPSGLHTTTNNSAALIHADDSSAVNSKVGMMVYNITDGSSCTVTASITTGATCTLVGGTQNDWDINDVYQFGPGPSQSGSVFHVFVAGTIRHPATVNYLACYRVNAAAVLTVDMASDSMQFNGEVGGVYSAGIGAGDCIDSPATAGSYMCIHNRSATVADGLNYRNQWEDGGAS